MEPKGIPFLRTPESRFERLPDFAYEPKYLKYGDLRMAYVDERTGDSSGTPIEQTFLCLHGQPTWSYLYRKMIPTLLHHKTRTDKSVSRRVLAPDLLGFGRSDKPTNEAIYDFDFHRNALLHFIRTLDLRDITLVVQDWGGILGLTLPVSEPDRFSRLLVMNTTIPVGQKPTEGFLQWRDFSNRSPDMKIGSLMGRSCRHLSQSEMDAYDAPFPDIRYKAGVRRFPNMVMVERNMPGVQVAEESLAFYGSCDKFRSEDIFMACGPEDPVLGPAVMKALSKVWKNGCHFAEIPGAGHFVQEWGDQVARMAIEVFETAGTGTVVEGVEKCEGSSSKSRL